ncbi:MAG TPA: hypothetical protein VGJ60_30040 [Chloroflexota bacterium]
MSPHSLASARLPRSGSAALASGALIQALLGAEFVLAGLSKAVDPDFGAQFRAFVSNSPGARGGPLAGLVQSLVVPHADLMAELTRWTELGAGLVLLVTALEVLRRRLSDPVGAEHAYEPLVALISASAAFIVGGMSAGIYLIEGGRLPTVSAGFAFGSPIAIELFLVPLALGIAWLELARFQALRRSSQTSA